MRRSSAVRVLGGASAAALAVGLVVGLVGALATAAEPRGRLFEGGDRPLAIGPLPKGIAGRDAASCNPCHKEIVAEWRGSLHARSWSDPVFQAAYTIEPLAFCRNCHAPLHSGDKPTGVAADEGVSCVACHVREGTVLAGDGDAANDGDAPHPVTRDARLGASAYCGPCHDFGFLAGGVRGHPRAETAELQQSTFSEWLAAGPTRAPGADGAARQSCQDCHMAPSGAGAARHRGHAFPGRLDARFLAASVAADVSAAREAGRVVITARLTPRGVGHDVPTGDLFRRLVLTVWPVGREAQAVRLEYTRRFGDRVDPKLGSVRYEVEDTRVGEPGSGSRTLALDAPAGAPLRWRLDYLLMPKRLAQDHHVPASENVTRLNEGTLTAP